MANAELVRTLDFILNRCNEVEIDAVVAAVNRRQRDLTLFGSAVNLPDPKRLAQEMRSQLNMEGAIASLRDSVKDFALRTIRQEAPELSEEQMQSLIDSWIPDSAPAPEGGAAIPPDLLGSMIEQFISFSQGEMEETEDQQLRAELGPWPERYWKAFPQVCRLIITDYLKGEINEKDFRMRIGMAMGIG